MTISKQKVGAFNLAWNGTLQHLLHYTTPFTATESQWLQCSDLIVCAEDCQIGYPPARF